MPSGQKAFKWLVEKQMWHFAIFAITNYAAFKRNNLVRDEIHIILCRLYEEYIPDQFSFLVCQTSKVFQLFFMSITTAVVSLGMAISAAPVDLLFWSVSDRSEKELTTAPRFWPDSENDVWLLPRCRIERPPFYNSFLSLYIPLNSTLNLKLFVFGSL